jgi:hypothetical protein
MKEVTERSKTKSKEREEEKETEVEKIKKHIKRISSLSNIKTED